VDASSIPNTATIILCIVITSRIKALVFKRYPQLTLHASGHAEATATG
jgi:hypothetical protein